MFRLAGFTPPSELNAASELRLLRRRGFSLASLDSGSIFKTNMPEGFTGAKIFNRLPLIREKTGLFMCGVERGTGD